jgi:hypothetical protein
MIKKRKDARVSTLADSATSGSSSPKSGARKTKLRRRSSEEAPSTENFSEAADAQVATPEAADGPARRLDPILAAVGGALEPSDPTAPAADVVLHAPVLPPTSSVLPSLATNPVASNTRPGAPVSNNSPLPSAPSHGRFILPSEKIERLSRKPTRAQVGQVTTNLLRDNCPYGPVDEVHHDDYLSFETLLMRQYVSQPLRMNECSQWKSWGRRRFCEELLKAVPDISVARPESSTNFVELIAKVVTSGSICGRKRASIDISNCPPISRCYASAASDGCQDFDIEITRTAN